MSVHEHLSRVDLWVVAVYLLGITVFGLYASRRVSDSTTFFVRWTAILKVADGGAKLQQRNTRRPGYQGDGCML